MANTILKATFLMMFLLLFASSAVSQCNGTNFNAPFNLDAGGSPSDVVAADLNADGRTDLLFVDSNSSTISIYMGSVTGTPAAIRITSVQNPSSVAVADFNHDGKLDLAVTHGTFNTQFVAILLGDGAGNFGAPTDFTANLTKPIVVADFNGDGNVDVFLGNSSTNNSQILLGNGAGGLAAPFFVTVGNNTNAVAGDFNGDGKIDLVLVHSEAVTLSIALGNGNGTFAPSTNIPLQARSVALGDFNGDGKLDLVTGGQADGVSVLLGNGSGGFAPTPFSMGFLVGFVSAGDFNGDGKTDLATAAGNTVSILLGDGTGKLGPHSDYKINQTPTKLALGDFNGDGRLDVATVSQSSGFPPQAGGGTILFGDGAGKLLSPAVLVGVSPFAIDRGDLNGDGFADLAVANISNNSVSIWLGTATGTFGSATTVSVGNQPRSAVLADLNGDQKLDLITANFNAGTISILFGDGAGGFSSPTNISVPGFNPEYATVGDFNNDGKPDLAVAYLNSTFLSVLLGNGTGGFSAATNSAVPSGAQQIATGDFNGDGKADLAVPNISGLSILLGNGNGTFSGSTISTSSTATSVGTGDFNSDGKIDLVTSVTNANAVLVYLGNGQGSFALSNTFSVGSGPDSIAVADFDGDGNPDLAVGNSEGSVSVLPGDGAGNFGSARTYINGGGVTRSIVSGDFNSDGRTDLACANQGGFPSQFSPNVSIIFNGCSAQPPSVPTISILDVAVDETDAGSINASVAIKLSSPSTKTVGVSFYTADKEAVKGQDYQTTAGRITFAPGVTTQNVTIPVLGDTIDEFDERFNVILAFPTSAFTGAPGTVTIVDNDPPPTVSISDTSVLEGNSGTTLAVFPLTLSAISGKPITVQYSSADGTAVAGNDYVAKVGSSVVIPPGTISSTLSIAIIGDTSVEPNETFFVNVTSVDNAVLARGQAVGTILNDDNPIDQPDFFVRQHYRDFLNREPDDAGLQFWIDNIISCGSNTQCIETKRINVSAAFFLSIEFQQTGNLVYKMYKAGFGNLAGKPVAVDRTPFITDTRQIQSTPAQVIVGQGSWETQLETNKQAFALAFVQRPAFQTAHASQDAATYVSSLFANAGVTPTSTETAAAVNAFNSAGGGDAGRASALRSVAESNSVSNKVFNEAFVLMQYFGYLQRNPYEPPEPTLDYQGYNFWLNKLNQFNGNYINAEMVKAFLASSEYRQRFGP